MYLIQFFYHSASGIAEAKSIGCEMTKLRRRARVEKVGSANYQLFRHIIESSDYDHDKEWCQPV
jgi:hypothetical protein